MGANIDYAIVIASRYQELKNTMSHRDAMIETLNFAFPTVITSGTILAVAGTLIGQMTSEAAIVGIGQSLGRGTVSGLVRASVDGNVNLRVISRRIADGAQPENPRLEEGSHEEE